MIRNNFELGVNKASGQWQQIRTLKRKLSYPEAYIPKVPPQTGKKDHSSYFQRAIKGWLGPRNLRGEYYRNKYYYPPQNHQPNYVVPDGNTIVEALEPQAERRSFGKNKRDSSLHPFPMNLECKTASVISNELKAKIYDDATVKQLKHEEIAQKYGIKIARIEAIIRLYGLEQQWKESVCILLSTYHMTRLFFSISLEDIYRVKTLRPMIRNQITRIFTNNII